MKTKTLKQLLLYNYRYWFGYAIIALFAAYFLFWQLRTIPPGFSQLELETASQHTTFQGIIDMPVYPVHAILQWGAISLFGVNVYSVRLPAILIAIATAFFLYSLMKKWFGKSTALLSIALLLSSDWFLFVTRHGTGVITFSFWLAIALNGLTKLLERKNWWLVIFAGAVGALLFTPLGIYAAAAMIITLLSGRVFRERALEAPIIVKLISALVLILSTGAVLFAGYHNHDFARQIFGITAVPGATEFLRNIFMNTAAIVAVLPAANPEISPSGILFVRFFELTFILFGIFMLYKTRVNRLNLAVILISIMLVSISGLVSNQWGSSLLLVPATIFITAGIRHLMHRWKQTFPKNPYARVAAYIPLGVLFVSVTLLHYQTYFRLWPSQTKTHVVYNQDLPLLLTELNRADGTCFVVTDNNAIRTLATQQESACQPVFEQPSDSANINRTIVHAVSTSAPDFVSSEGTARVLTSEVKENSARWLVIDAKPAQ